LYALHTSNFINLNFLRVCQIRKGPIPTLHEDQVEVQYYEKGVIFKIASNKIKDTWLKPGQCLRRELG
jgi:hypothetical protein